MPKELHEIQKFQSGTILTPSDKDIPEDSASYSLNLDSVTEDGKLKSIPTDEGKLGSTSATGYLIINSIPTNGAKISIDGKILQFQT